MNRQGTIIYPEGEELQAQIEARHRKGLAWRLIFAGATMVGIITLVALLYNIINQTFGFAAVENRVDPAGLARDYETRTMLQGAVLSSEDDTRLAEAVAGDPAGVSFFGYSHYQANADQLRAVAVDELLPGEAGYALERPLFLYTAAEIAMGRPEVAAFIHYYLAHADAVLAETGYFAADEAAVAATRQAWLNTLGLDALPAVDAADYSGTISIVGSSTMQPLTRRIAEMFIDDGFRGAIRLQSNGSDAGFTQLCRPGGADISQASRAMTAAEVSECRDNRLQPRVLRVAHDALTVVTSSENRFIEAVSLEQLGALFTAAERWSDLDESWPSSAIQRYVPGPGSGTLDYFADTVLGEALADLPHDALVGILRTHISRGLGRRLEREQRFYENVLVFDTVESYEAACAVSGAPAGCTAPARSQENVYDLVVQWVVQPNVVQTWSFVDSLFRRSEIAATARAEYPNAELQFRTWLTGEFITRPQAAEPEVAGVRTAILGSLWVIAITIAFSFPIGVGAAIYLEEYARPNAINRFIQTNINNLAGVPSIIYGMLGLAIFVRLLVAMTSGAAFGATDAGTTANGRTILSAGLTLGLLILPIIIINAQEAIRAVPNSLRMASYGLGGTKWQTIWSHVLPNALPGILTGTILAMSRAIGETAPLVVIGASTFITADPQSPFSKFTTLPIQIYQWTSRPQAEFRNIAGAAIIVLLALLLSLNATAVILRNRFSRKLT
ncbi:MAG: phosphate ABC transporter permease PstA [Anaerolineae bacterium]|nr:phosphate ABC transporter permease PstA [Anaerolineae bacterium]